MNIKVYGTQFCPFCVAAKDLLTAKGLQYESIDLTNDPDLMEKLAQELNYRAVPMIFVDDKFIGGFTDLQKLDSEGRLK